MDAYLRQFREMVSLRGLTDHTVTSYSTYVRVYLDYLSDILHKMPEEVSWEELRGFVRWLQKARGLSDRTINCCVSQLRFFTIYVLHKPWDPTQLPLRKFDSYLPFVPTREEMRVFLSSITDLKFKALLCLMFSSGLRIGEAWHLKCPDIEHSRGRILVRASKNRSSRYAQLSERAWRIVLQYWYSLPAGKRPRDFLFTQKRDVSSPRYREGLHGPSCTASPGSLARTFPNARIAGTSNSITIPAGTGTAPAARPCKRNYGLTSAGPR